MPDRGGTVVTSEEQSIDAALFAGFAPRVSFVGNTLKESATLVS